MDRIEFLVTSIRKHRDLYYNGVSEISDAAFDSMVEELKKLAPGHEILKEIGAKPQPSYQTAKHKIPMGSLENVFTDQEMQDHVSKKMKASLYALQWKLDGFSISAEYEDGKLVRALTRGDGLEGIVISFAFAKMQNTKIQLPKNFTGSLRGEGVISYKDFEKLAVKMKAAGQEPFANTRNASSGISKRKDGSDAEAITVVWFDISNGKQFASETEKMNFIRSELGLQAVETYEAENLVSIAKIYNRFLEKFLGLDRSVEGPTAQFDADGIVIKINDCGIQKQLGFDGLNPKFSLAWKFPQPQKKVIIKKINWFVGSSGRITPVAVIPPTQMSGASIENLSLHNYQMVVDKQYSEGATVMASRHGGVIPQVDELVLPGTGVIGAPKVCPLCGTETKVDGAFLICPATNCPAKLESIFFSWIAVSGWTGLGDASVRKLLESGRLKEPRDFYRLTIADMIECGIGEANGAKILQEIGSSKPLSIPQVFAGMAFDQVGEGRIERMMAGGLNSVEKLLTATADQIRKCPGLGDSVVKNYSRGLELRKPWITNVLAYVHLKEQITAKVGGRLMGWGLQFTGKMEKTRDEMEKRAQENGAKIGWAAGLKNVLVMNSEARLGSKAQEAKQKGFGIITEKEFLALVP